MLYCIALIQCKEYEEVSVKIKMPNSIGVRLLRKVFGYYLVITLLVTSIQIYLEYSNVEKGVLVELRNIGRSFEDGIAKASWDLDTDSIESILVGIKKIDLISGVKVTDDRGEILGSIGLFVEEYENTKVVRQLTADEVKAREVALFNEEVDGTFYEYRIPLVYNSSEDQILESIGYVYLYANQGTAIKRFQNSFFLIIINAIIKTSFLWIIFLYFSRRILSRPLADLAQASQALRYCDERTSHFAEQLKKIEQSSSKDDLQMLAENFLTMQHSILEKIYNLNAINQFAVNLSKSKTEEAVYEQIVNLVSGIFGSTRGLVLDSEGAICWTSISYEQGQSLVDETYEYIQNFDTNALREKHDINYHIQGQFDSKESGQGIYSQFTFLYLPLTEELEERYEMWLFGPLNRARLDSESKLNNESYSLLRVVVNIASGILANLRQQRIIEKHVHDTQLRQEVMGSVNLMLQKEIQERTSIQKQLLEREEELLQSHRDLETLSYISSHNLSELLRNIQELANRLAEKYHKTLDESGRDYIDSMQRATKDMGDLINDLSIFYKVSTEALNFSSVDLNAVVGEVLDDLKVQINEASAEIKVDSLPVIEADSLHMRQLFQNLLANALEYQHQGNVPKIDISSGIYENDMIDKDSKKYFYIQIADNGIGFESKHSEEVFQLLGNSGGKYSGGVGLALCRRIIERHGGQITAESEVGKGSTFIIVLRRESATTNTVIDN